MDYAERLERVSVLGAAGKMGSGIVLLLAMEMADLALKGGAGRERLALDAVDVSEQALAGLVAYLREQVRKAAEKRVAALGPLYAGRGGVATEADVVARYVSDVLAIVRPTTRVEAAREANVVFEAAPENLDLKVRLLAGIATGSGRQPWMFTNTSSIPIQEIDARAGLGGRVMGFHFYNPPAVQKLVELIPAASTPDEVIGFADALCTRLGKVGVVSADRAGFIGNGHFMRDLLHAMSEVERLAAEMPFVEAVYGVNRVSQDFLVRPMGIFQLIDYVGLDVCQSILAVMNPRTPGEHLHSVVIDRVVGQGVRGGQHHDGSQKDGLLRYEEGKPTGAYDPDARSYVPFAAFRGARDSWLGAPPDPAPAWKAVVRDPAREEVLARFFSALNASAGPGAELARRYGARSREIGQQLVDAGVARSAGDVNRVLMLGFFHAYGPINTYFE